MAEEANDVNEVVEPDTTEAESSPVENESQEDELMQSLKDDDESTDDKTSEDTDESESEETEEESTTAEAGEDETEDESDEAEETDEPTTKADQRKEQLNTEIRDLVSEKNRLKQEIEAINQQVYAVPTKEELIDEGYSEEEARVEALERKLELKDYNERVVEVQVGLAQDAQRIEREFPIFNPDSPEYDQDVAGQAAEILSDSLEYDPETGQIIGTRTEPYKLYKAIAGAYQKSSVSGQVKGQKEAVRRMARVEAPSSANKPEPKSKDPLIDILASDDD